MNAETMRAEAERLQTEVQQMLVEHQKMKDALVAFTARTNSKLGELGAYQKLLAAMEEEEDAG